jgi:putative tricarboxylic transport membrane protein
MRIVSRLVRAGPFLLIAAIGVYLYQVADQFDFVTRAGRPGPDVWPKIVVSLIFFAAVWGALEALIVPRESDHMGLLVRDAVRAVGRESEAQHDLDVEAGLTAQPHVLRAVAAMAVLLAFVGGIAYVGFTVATCLLMFSVMVLAGYARYPIAALIAVLGALSFFLVFQRVAYVSLPLGVGPFKTLSLTLMALFGVR